MGTLSCKQFRRRALNAGVNHMAAKLQMNVPQTFELAFDEGLRVHSKYSGDQVMFSLTNGEKWYCDPFIASKIRDAKIGANTPFTVCKREVINGNRRVVEYEVERIMDVSLAPPAADPDPRPTMHAVESPNTSAVFVGAGAVVNPAAAAAPSTVALMKMAGIGAIDSVLEVEKYARSKGMVDFCLGPAEIQDIAATIFIEMNKKGGRA